MRLRFGGIDLEKFSNDQGIEACAIRLLYNSYNICIVTIYRAPTGNFTCFIKKLEAILCSLYTLHMQFITRGDINVNYFIHNSTRKILDALLSSFNLSSTVYLPTRPQNKSATAIYNIFIDTIDTFKFPTYVVSPLHNGLSDHDAQLNKLSDIDIKIHNSKFKIIRRTDTYPVFDFLYKLSFETWNSIFDSNDVNSMFNSFLNIYLRIFYSSFSLKKS